jgi:hypothetical protein
VQAAVLNVSLGGMTIPQPGKPIRDWFNKDEALVKSRFPEAWNFNQFLASRPPVDVVVLDEGFFADQPDLTITRPPGFVNSVEEHGTSVAAIIGAKFDDGVGIDGAAPFVNVIGASPEFSMFGNYAKMLTKVLARAPAPSVINVSVGYNWFHGGPPTAAERDIAENQGKIIRKALRTADHTIVVSAAGNGCSDPKCTDPAVWTNPFNWAALGPDLPGEPHSENVIVVEGLEADGATRLLISNVGGTIKAIGRDVLTLTSTTPRPMDGTSASAPLVAAAVAMMLQASPGMTALDVKRNLGITKGNAPALNAFEALWKSIPNPERVISDLNLGGPDGRVDRADFAIFSRGYNEIRSQQIVSDWNHDRIIDSNDRFHPRLDLNGDGVVTAGDFRVMEAGWTDTSIDPKTLRDQLEPSP